MADKGGKGYSAGKGFTASKSLPSKQGSLKKQANESLNNSIQIDSDSDSEEQTQASSKANGKVSSGGKSSFETPTAKGQLGKGGKASTIGKGGGKGSVPQSTAKKPPRNEGETKLELDTPKNSRILLDCEVAEILLDIHEHMVILSEDPTIKMSESFDKAFQYLKNGNSYTNAKSVRHTLETLKKCGVNDGEICMIGSVCPETVEEVYALVPSLKANRLKNEGPIRDVLSSLAKFKCSK